MSSGAFFDPSAGGELARQLDLPEEAELEVDAEQFPRERYKALELLGSGGSGLVYRCLDRLLNNQVAIKLLLSLTAEQIISFQNEAKAGSTLQHPGLVSVRDFGVTAGGAPYMVMDFVPGISLDRYIEEEGALTEAEVVQVFSQVAQALSYAHQKGIFHRDMKTSNIIVSLNNGNEPQAHVIDFGVAIYSQEKTMVSGNVLVGTPAYMSPDQAAGRPFDARSEVYSLGCVMFEALTGSVPFSGDTALATINMHASTPAPRLADFAPEGKEFSERFEELIARSLEKNPLNRFQSMDKLREALEGAEQTPAQQVLFSLPEEASDFDPGAKKSDRALILVCITVFALVVSGCFAFNTLVNLIASKSEPTGRIHSDWDTPELSKFNDNIRNTMDDQLINGTQHVHWKSTYLVKVRNGNDADLKDLVGITAAKALTSISIEGGKYSPIVMKELSKLNIQNLFLTEVDLSEVDKLVLKKLTTINLSGCRIPDFNPFSRFVDCPIKAIFLFDNKLDNKAFESLKSYKKLTYLGVHGCKGMTDGWQFAPTLTSAAWVNPDFKTYPDEGFMHLVSLPKLASLSLDAGRLTPEQYAGIGKISKLHGLLLNGDKIIDTANLETIRNSSTPDLHLSFKFPCVNVESLKVLTGRSWRQLSFFDTNMNDAGLKVLERIDCDSFVFDEPHITLQGVTQLLIKRPLKMLCMGSSCPTFTKEQMFELQKIRPTCTLRYSNEDGDLMELRNKGHVFTPASPISKDRVD
jgi:serine/threonine protein kinase